MAVYATCLPTDDQPDAVPLADNGTLKSCCPQSLGWVRMQDGSILTQNAVEAIPKHKKTAGVTKVIRAKLHWQVILCIAQVWGDRWEGSECRLATL